MYKINRRTNLVCFGSEEISEDTKKKGLSSQFIERSPGLTWLSKGKIEERVREHQKLLFVVSWRISAVKGLTPSLSADLPRSESTEMQIFFQNI